MTEDAFVDTLKCIIQESQNKTLLWEVQYEDFYSFYHYIIEYVGESGFIMFTENRAILCMEMAPNLRICIMKKNPYSKKDFKVLNTGFEIVGKGFNELPSIIKQFFMDIKDNVIKIILISILFFIIFNPEKVNTGGLVSLCVNILSIMSMFLSMVFVFIGFIYSDKERSIDTYIHGNGDSYYKTDKYIIELSVLILCTLIVVIAIGGITSNSIPDILLKNNYFSPFLSYKNQYIICLLLTWLSIVMMIICFDALVNYYLKSMRNKYFVDAVDEKVKRDYKK